MIALGKLSVAADDLRVQAWQLPQSTFALLFQGDDAVPGVVVVARHVHHRVPAEHAGQGGKLEAAEPGATTERMLKQTGLAIAGADLVLFMIDARAGLSGRIVELRASAHGHYHADAEINGRRVQGTDQQVSNWRSVLREAAVVPLRVTRSNPRRLYAIATGEAVTKLRGLHFNMELLGKEGDPLTTDVYLVRDDRETPTGFMAAEGRSAQFFEDQGKADVILSPSHEGLYLAVPAGRSIEEFHFPGARHGHNEKLVPDMALLDPFEPATVAWAGSLMGAPAAEPSLSNEELAGLGEITPEAIRRYLDRYTGNAPLNVEDGTTISSRHIQNSGNTHVTSALVRDLKAIGGTDIVVRRHRFEHEGQSLYNVEAEFRGSEPDAMVLVTAHLDSTAAFSYRPHNPESERDYNPKTDPAPGADDDGSGVAAVLAAAMAIAKIRRIKPLKRTIRFVLFNAEEHGLVGSKAYARAQAAQKAPISTVFQMDMVGYRGNREVPPRPVEVHVGYQPSADVEARSRVLADMIAKLAPKVSPHLKPVQIYPNPETPDIGDPAAGRSDHASFHERGYAACAVSEDFFPPSSQPNPDYHKHTDKDVDYSYAADIARLVAAAALLAANS